MWIDGDEGRRSDAGVDGIRHETFTKASDDDIVKKASVIVGYNLASLLRPFVSL